MIADRPSKSKGSTRLVVDEALISSQGWVPVDSLGYVTSVSSFVSTPTPAEPKPDAGHASRETDQCDQVDEDILDLTAADVTAARLARSLRMPRAQQTPPASRAAIIPSRDIVPIGGVNLQTRTPEQPFESEPERANDNFARYALLVVLLLAVLGGYAFTALNGDDRRAIEVQPPENALTKITML